MIKNDFKKNNLEGATGWIPLPNNQDLESGLGLTTEQQITIIRLCILDFFDTLGITKPHEAQIEQFAEKLIDELRINK